MGGYHAGLAEDKGLHRDKLVAVAVEEFKGEVLGQHLERLGVEAESQGAGEGDVGRGLPVTLGELDEVEYAVAFAVKALDGEGCEPFGVAHPFEPGDGGRAGEGG